jgi:hypothetical protein
MADNIDLAANTKLIAVMALVAKLTKENLQTAHE